MVSLSIKQVSLRDRNPPLIKLTREGRVKKKKKQRRSSEEGGKYKNKEVVSVSKV
jgi:hypothetical protein